MIKSYFEEVYHLVRSVPRGKVTTYGAIAKKLGMSPRTVGYALHLNPDPLKTPCHRVVNFKGRVAPGYAFGGKGEQRKRLEKEGIVFRDENHLEIKKYFFAV
jgi:methylated-DNA-protein-cysteine methyltransferase-like protein